MKIILITDDDPVDSWVAGQIAQQIPVVQILLLQEGEPRERRHRVKQFLRNPLRPLEGMLRSLLLEQLDRQRQCYMTQHLWNGQDPELSPQLAEIVGVPNDQFNGPDNAAHIRSLSPDLIITCGGPVLKPDIFNIPRLGCLNVQFGISDAYRGQHTLFWPIAQADWENVGATIHKVDQGVNTGEVLAQVRPTLTPEDTEFSVEVKTAIAILTSMLELLSHLKDQTAVQAIKGRERIGEGKYILYRDRTPFQELQYRIKAQFRTLPTPIRDEQRSHDWSCMQAIAN